ncbi:MAG: dienelactone hydrolase family protein [Actinobacteria bacterium]|nr:dienelactone hydrolase family protein [Actinomycetota bacterium]
MTVRTEDVRLGRLRLHMAHPESKGDAGVLLYPTIFGIDDAMRGFAAELALGGLTAVVWDPYDGDAAVGGVGEMLARSKRCEDGQMIADLTEIVDHLRGLGLDRIAALGWCFGGRVALLHAGGDQRLEAVASYNPTIYSEAPLEVPGIGLMSKADFGGQTMDEFGLARSIRGPVQVARPARDLTHPAEYRRLFEALCERPDPTVYEYHPHATHGFSYTPGEANERAHRLAWANTAALFDSTLGSSNTARVLTNRH